MPQTIFFWYKVNQLSYLKLYPLRGLSFTPFLQAIPDWVSSWAAHHFHLVPSYHVNLLINLAPTISSISGSRELPLRSLVCVEKRLWSSRKRYHGSLYHLTLKFICSFQVCRAWSQTYHLHFPMSAAEHAHIMMGNLTHIVICNSRSDVQSLK